MLNYRNFHDKIHRDIYVWTCQLKTMSHCDKQEQSVQRADVKTVNFSKNLYIHNDSADDSYQVFTFHGKIYLKIN